MKFTLKTENKVKSFDCTEKVNGGIKLVTFKIDFDDLIALKPTVISWKTPITNLTFTFSSNDFSNAISEIPVISQYNKTGENVVTLAILDELKNSRIEKRLGKCGDENEYYVTLFENCESTFSSYTFTLRIDERKIKYYDAIIDVAKWWKEKQGLSLDANLYSEPTYSLKCEHCKNIAENEKSDLQVASTLGLTNVFIEDAKLSGDGAKENVESLQTFFGECQRSAINVTFNNENNLSAANCNYSAEGKLTFDIISKLFLKGGAAYVNPPVIHLNGKKEDAFYTLACSLFGTMQISAQLTKLEKDVLDVIRYILYYQNENKELLQTGNLELPTLCSRFDFVKKTLGDKAVTLLTSCDTALLSSAFEDVILINGKNYFYADLTSTDLNYTYTVLDSNGTLISAGEVIGGSVYKIEAKNCSIIQFVQK